MYSGGNGICLVYVTYVHTNQTYTVASAPSKTDFVKCKKWAQDFLIVGFLCTLLTHVFPSGWLQIILKQFFVLFLEIVTIVEFFTNFLA